MWTSRFKRTYAALPACKCRLMNEFNLPQKLAQYVIITLAHVNSITIIIIIIASYPLYPNPDPSGTTLTACATSPHESNSVSVCLRSSVCLSVCMSVRLFVCLSCLSVCLSVYSFASPSVCISACLFISLSVRLSVCLVCLFLSILFMCQFVWLSVSSERRIQNKNR